jgi:hypothetical protein
MGFWRPADRGCRSPANGHRSREKSRTAAGGSSHLRRMLSLHNCIAVSPRSLVTNSRPNGTVMDTDRPNELNLRRVKYSGNNNLSFSWKERRRRQTWLAATSHQEARRIQHKKLISSYQQTAAIAAESYGSLVITVTDKVGGRRRASRRRLDQAHCSRYSGHQAADVAPPPVASCSRSGAVAGCQIICRSH